MKMRTHRLRSILVATAVALVTAGFLVPAASADDYLVGLWGKARIGNFEETWQGDDPAQFDESFGVSDSHKYTGDGYGCQKRWSGLGMKVDFWIFGSMDDDPCDAGLFGRAQLTSTLWHTSNGISPGDPARKARKKAVGRCGKSPYNYCGTKGYVLSTHISECAGGRVPSVIARVRKGRVSSLLVFTTGCE